jgi:hypothetical protein
MFGDLPFDLKDWLARIYFGGGRRDVGAMVQLNAMVSIASCRPKPSQARWSSSRSGEKHMRQASWRRIFCALCDKEIIRKVGVKFALDLVQGAVFDRGCVKTR